jgi:hypothetical protein
MTTLHVLDQIKIHETVISFATKDLGALQESFRDAHFPPAFLNWLLPRCDWAGSISYHVDTREWEMRVSVCANMVSEMTFNLGGAIYRKHNQATITQYPSVTDSNRIVIEVHFQ